MIAVEIPGAAPSLFSRLDPRVRILLAASLVVAVASAPARAAALPVVGLVLLLSIISRLPARRAGRTVLAVLPFAGMVALSLPWLVAGTPLLSLDVGPWPLTMTAEGLASAGEVLARAVLAAITLAALVASTPFEQLAEGLRGLGLPPALVLTLCSLHRYTPVLIQESGRMIRAARARGGQRGVTLSVMGSLIASLLIRSIDRADRVHRAMVSRGFDGTVPTEEGPSHLERRDVVWLLGGTSVIAVSVLFALVAKV